MKKSATKWPLLKKPVPFSSHLSRECNLESRFMITCIIYHLQICPNMSRKSNMSKCFKHFRYVQICLSKILLVLSSFAELFDALALSAVIRNWSVRQARLSSVYLQKKVTSWLRKRFFSFLADRPTNSKKLFSVKICKSELCFRCKVFFFRPIRLSYVGISYQNRQIPTFDKLRNMSEKCHGHFLLFSSFQNVSLSKFHCCLFSVFPQTCRPTFSNFRTSKSDLHNLVDNVFDKNNNCLN